MRHGPYEVTIVDDDSIAFEEHNINGAVYVCGKARREYRVSVRIHRDEEGNFPVENSHVSLSIDGIRINYQLKLRLDESSPDFRETFKFRGYRKARHTYRAFQFSIPTGVAVEGQAESHQGLIKVEFHEADVSTMKVAHTCVNDDDADSTSSADNTQQLPSPTSLPRSKKYLQLPSLTTTPGNVWVYKRSSRPKSPAKWVNKRAAPDASFEIFYHTENKLMFLQEFCEARLARAAANSVPVDLTNERETIGGLSVVPKLVKVEQQDMTIVDLTTDTVQQNVAVVTPPSSSNKAVPIKHKLRSKSKRAHLDAEENEPELQVNVPAEEVKKKEATSGSRTKKRSRASGVDSLAALVRST